MTNQSNANNYQEMIINNAVMNAVSTSDNSTLQGLQMTNQFAICANPGSTPVLVPYISPMLLSHQTNKISLDGNNQDNRSHNGQLQLANNITIPANMLNSGNLPLGLSYINLSQLTSQAGGTAIPFQLALNTGTNQQFTLPLASITQLTNDLQISNAYTLAPQIKFEPEVHNNDQVNQLSNQTFQKSSMKQNNESIINDLASNNKRGRKKVLVRKTSPFIKKQKIEEEEQIEPKLTAINNENEIMYDHKGRPFIYPCNQCPKKFTQNSRLTAHLRCHSGIRPYTCTQCGFSFTQKSYLIRHAAVHKEDRPFTCAKCLKTYKHYGSLANHRKLHCRENLVESNVNGTRNQDCNGMHHLDETIEQTIESVQMNHQNNYILAYTSNSSDLQSTPIVFFNQNTLGSNNNIVVGQNQSVSLSDLHLPGSGPVVFPSQELPSISAVSLLPPNRSAINELKAITTHRATNVDVDENPTVTAMSSSSSSCITLAKTVMNSSSIDFQQHIKQESTYFTVPLHQSDSGN